MCYQRWEKRVAWVGYLGSMLLLFFPYRTEFKNFSPRTTFFCPKTLFLGLFLTTTKNNGRLIFPKN